VTQLTAVRVPLNRFDKRCGRLPAELALVSVVSDRMVRPGVLTKKLAIVVLSAAALAVAALRIGMAPATAVIVSATLVGGMWTVFTMFPDLIRRKNALWTFSADKKAVELLGARVPSRRYGLRRTSLPYFTVRLGHDESTLWVVDADSRYTDLMKAGCRFELLCTPAGRIVGCAILKGPERAEIDAGGRLSVAVSNA
jgi:hypothetical protein